MPVEEKKRKMVAAAPEWLKGRVERGVELPPIEINDRRQHDGDEDEMRADVLGGKMLKELYIELMDLMVPRWDDARRA